jgi:hypothetical protein
MVSRLVVVPSDGLSSPSAETQWRKGQSMKKVVSESKRVERKTLQDGTVLCKASIRVNEETIGEIGNEKKDIHYELIGGRKYPVRHVWVEEKMYLDIMRLEWADIKRDERNTRCRIQDGKGGSIRCPEKNRCCYCKKARGIDFDNHHDTSLDALMAESEMVPGSAQCGIGSEYEDLEYMDWLVAELNKIDERYGKIFRALLDGMYRPAHIHQSTKIADSTVRKLLPLVQELAQELYLKK